MKHQFNELLGKWLAEAARHEQAAQEHYETDSDGDSEERLLHLENARVLRNCANDLRVILAVL